MTKREWQIEMANRFAKRDKTEELIDAQNTIRQLTAKLECYERLADASEMASNPMGVKSRVALRNVREMKTIMTKEEEIRKAVEAEREACAKLCDLAMLQNQEAINELENDEHIAKCFIEGAMNQLVKTAKAIRARGKA
jgi:hypothetical protein